MRNHGVRADHSMVRLVNLSSKQVYCDFKLKLGAYRNRSGDAAAAVKLPYKRTAPAMLALVPRLVQSMRLKAGGYGEQDSGAECTPPEH